jgi:hypothetical protein
MLIAHDMAYAFDPISFAQVSSRTSGKHNCSKRHRAARY